MITNEFKIIKSVVTYFSSSMLIKQIRKKKENRKYKTNWKDVGRKSKKYISKKNILECLGNYENCLRKIKIYKIEKFNNVFFD
jgi:hypothetical protein